MNKLKILCIALVAFGTLNAQAQPKSWTADNGNGTFTNPLFYDEFSDPDILRVGDDYYLAGTTMHAVPGLVILHSKDLVNWEFASYCFDRFDFTEDRFSLKNHEEIYGQGIWAPCIRYANGQFYVFSNVNGKGLQCYTAKDIRGPWTHHNMKGNIYDLGVLFDDDGKIYAIHGYGTVKCTELKPDMSGPIDGTERVIIPEGNGVGEGHHMYKIDGMYYLISTDYSPNGRTLCSRSKSIWGPYETRVITADETYGYHAASLTQVPRGTKYRIGEDGTKFQLGPVDKDATACTNAHQGGIVQYKDGSWWALFMQDFHSIGRTVCLMPMTWEDGWPMVGLKGNLGRAPRTWFMPGTKLGCYSVGEEPQPLRAPYDRSDDFNYSTKRQQGPGLKPVWQWNHNPDDKLWSLHGGRLRIQSQPAEQLMWARNTLTQRVIGPKSMATVELYTKGMKDGDVCGLGNINVPCSWVGLVKQGNQLSLRCFEQLTNDTVTVSVGLSDGKIYLRMNGDYDNDQAQYAYSTDGKTFHTIGRTMPLSYQLISFQGSRHALFAFNIKGKQGGYAEFDNFTVDEPYADRSANIPYGKTIRIINKATGRPAIALKHGVLYDTHSGDKSDLTRFKVIDRGQGRVALQCADGRYLKVYGDGLPGDVRFTPSLSPAASSDGNTVLPTTDDIDRTTFLWQDFLDHDFMLLSLKNHRYLGKSPTTGSPYSADYAGPDPARRNGSVLHWEK
jgi:beta-xylosidase